MTPIHVNARDSALRRLHRANRWLIAGAVALTAVFAEVAASAFPGRSAKASGTAGSPRSGAATGQSSLKPPSEAPRSGTTPEVSPSQESAPSQGSSQEHTPTQESSPSQEVKTSQEASPSQPGGGGSEAPAHESAPTQESAPAQPEVKESAPAPAQESSPPVVSGGS